MSNNLPINTEGENLSIQGYALGIADDASTWLTTELANGTFKVPEGYDIKGECSSAALKIMNSKDKDGTPILSACSRESVLMFFKDMVSQNLSFVNDQCYPIKFGDTLVCMPSYFGEISIFKENFPMFDMSANVIYEGDTYDYCTDSLHGYNFVDNHKSSLANRDNAIIGAYGTIFSIENGKRVNGCVMSWKEIQASWSASKSKGTLEKFPEQMAKRTVFKKLCKMYNNTAKGKFTPMQMEAYKRAESADFESTDNYTATTASNHPSKEKGSARFNKLMAEKMEAQTVEPNEEMPF